MLGTKDGSQVHSRRLGEAIDDVPEAVIDRRVIADDPNAAAAKTLRSEQDIGAKPNAV